MDEMVLLGAGASVEANIPSAYDMTEEIAKQFYEGSLDGPHAGLLYPGTDLHPSSDLYPRMSQYARVLYFVVGGLLLQQGVRGRNPFEGVDVEELFNAVQLLAERNTLEAAPFIGSWHPMVAEFDRVEPPRARLDRLNRAIYESVTDEITKAFPKSLPPFKGKDIDSSIEGKIKKTVEAMSKGGSSRVSSSKSVSQAVGNYVVEITQKWLKNLERRNPRSSSTLNREFTTAVGKQQPRPGGGEVFHEVNELMIRSLAKIVWVEEAQRVEYLKPLLSLLKAQGRLVIPTLNYDNSVELLAESRGVPYETGIGEWSKTGTFNFEGDGLSLLKLHGSINWTLEKNERSDHRPMPHSTIRRVDYNDIQKSEFRPAVVFGQRNKLTAEGPFLDLLRTFREELSKAKNLTIIGYSFRDPHINEDLSQWLNQSINHRIRIINPGFHRSQEPYAQGLKELGATRIQVITEAAGEGLKQVFGPAA